MESEEYSEFWERMKPIAEQAENNVGIRYVEAKDGFARAELELKPEHFNYMGIVYGGVLYHLGDLTSGIAFMSRGGRGVTVTGEMQYLNSASASRCKKLVCEARVLKYGRRIAFVQAELMDENRTLFARSTYTFINEQQAAGQPSLPGEGAACGHLQK